MDGPASSLFYADTYRAGVGMLCCFLVSAKEKVSMTDGAEQSEKSVARMGVGASLSLRV